MPSPPGHRGWQRISARAHAFLQHHWRRLIPYRERLRFSEETVHLSLAVGVGVIGGLTNVLLFLVSEVFKETALHRQGDLLDVAFGLAWWQRLLLPAAGGLVGGLILHKGLHWVGSHGSANLLEGVVAGAGRLRFRPALLKSLSSVVSISTGASIGREGPITQLASAVASKLGQFAGFHPYRLRLLVACAAAAGMAAAYNAPIAGAVFAAQIVLGNFSMNLFAPLVLASVVATMVSRSVFGIQPWYEVPAFVEFTRVTQLPWFLVLGLLAGGLGAGFLKLMLHAESLFGRLPWPLPLKMALGGLVVGAIAIDFPQAWGNGYGATSAILHGGFPFRLLAWVFVAKLLATLMSVGSGAVGGVFTPTLFLGAALGGLFGDTLHAFGYATGLPTVAFALVGMGGMLAGTTHSVLLAVILVFEISLNHTLMPPLLVACAVASLMARRLHPTTVYTEPLRQRGLELEADNTRPGAATEQTVGDLMRAPVPPLPQNAPFAEIADRFLTSPFNFLPVVSAEGTLLGVVALQDLKEFLNKGQHLEGVIAMDVMRPPPPCLTPSQRLVDALPVLLGSDARNVPVVTTLKEARLVGTLVRAEALGVLSEAIAPRSFQPGRDAAA